jgi:NAD-dependent dihydropyrimidine dehydrogenase PreA subunit
MKTKITLARRISQIAAFLIILYGVFVWPHPIETPFPRITPGKDKIRTTKYAKGRILWVSGKESVFDIYLPTLACRFVARGGLFKSCDLHCFSENITWMTSIKILLPHIALFVLLAFLLARFWCGWICPLGSITDFMNWVRKRTGLSSWTVSPAWGRFFDRTRHFLLFFTFIVSALIAIPALGFGGVNDALFLVYCQICPARILYPPLGGVSPCWYDNSSALTMFMSVVGWGFLAFFFVGFFVPRLWCRICAVGAMVSYFNRGSLLSLRKQPRKCTYCGTCQRCCPVDIESVYKEREKLTVTDPKCLLCLRCVQECPEEGCLEANFGGKAVVKS